MSSVDINMLDKCIVCDYINCICNNRRDGTVVNGHGEINGETSSDGEPQDATEIYFACTANIYEGKCRLLQFQNAVER